MTPPRIRTSLARLVATAIACLTLVGWGDSENQAKTATESVASAATATTDESHATTGSGRTWIYPLITFRSEHPSRIEVAGNPRPEMVALSDGQKRAIVGNTSHSIRFALPHLAGATVSGGLALLPTTAGPSSESATFRLSVVDAASSNSQGDSRRDLWSRQIEAGASEEFEVALPEDLSDEAVLELALDIPKTAVRRNTLAAWIDPVVRKSIPGKSAASERPNLLVITFDTTRFDEFGLYGGVVPTPQLEKLAAAGVVFENAHSAAFGTTPSHASLMTSQAPARHGVYDNETILDDDRQTLAEQIAASGYRTAAFVGAAPLARSLGLAQGFDLYDDSLAFDPQSRLGSLTRHERSASETIQRFDDWVAESPDNPFFAWLHLYEAHQPYAPPERYAAPYMPNNDGSSTTPEVEAQLVAPDGSPKYLKVEELLATSPELVDRIGDIARARYRGEIAYLDDQLGKIWQLLERRKLFDRTIIVFTADHGENFLDRAKHMAFNHASLHRESTHLPLVVKLVDKPTSAGAKRRLLVSNVDLAPTLVELLGIEPDPSWEGQSLVPALRDESASPARDYVVLEGAHRHEIAVRTQRWLYREVVAEFRHAHKILRYLNYEPGRAFELYDLQSDPDERHSIYADDHPAVAPLREILAAHSSDSEHLGDVPSERIVSPEHTEALRALGYIE